MKLEKNNKYVKRLTAGLSAILVSASLLSGCSNNTVESVEPTEIVEATPTPTPERLQNLPLEEEMALLGVNDLNSQEIKQNVIETMIIIYKINNNVKVAFTYFVGEFIDNNTTFKIYEAFTDTLIFEITFYSTEDGFVFSDCLDKFIPLCDSLKDAEVLGFDGLLYQDSIKGLLEIPINNKTSYSELIKSGLDYLDNRIATRPNSMTYYELADLYIQSIPKEYRIVVSDFTDTKELEDSSNKVLSK